MDSKTIRYAPFVWFSAPCATVRHGHVWTGWAHSKKKRVERATADMGSRHCRSFFKLKSVPVEGQTGAANDQPRPIENKPKVTANKRALMKMSQTKDTPFKLPKGLVGTKSTAQVEIEGQVVNCLLDTGSQVTTVPQSFLQQCLSEYQIKPLYDLLEVEGSKVSLYLIWDTSS